MNRKTYLNIAVMFLFYGVFSMEAPAMYSLKDSIDDNLSGKEDIIQEVYYRSSNEKKRLWMLIVDKERNLCLDLSNLYLDSLEGLEHVAEALKVDQKSVVKLLLRKNYLKEIDLAEILKIFSNVRCIDASHNPLENVICPEELFPDYERYKCFKLNVNHTSLTCMPQVKSWSSVVKMKDTPLPIKERYLARFSDSADRNICLGLGVSACLFYFLLISRNVLSNFIARNKLDTECFALHGLQDFATLALFSGLYMFIVLDPARKIISSRDVRIHDKGQSIIAKMGNVCEDLAVIIGDSVSFPYNIVRGILCEQKTN